MEIIESKFFVWLDNFMKTTSHGEVMTSLSHLIARAPTPYVVFTSIPSIILRFFVEVEAFKLAAFLVSFSSVQGRSRSFVLIYFS